MEFTYICGDTITSVYRGSEGKVEAINVNSAPLARARLMQIQAMWNSTHE